VCGEDVSIHKDAIPNHGTAVPFEKAEFVGCDTPLDKVAEAILNEGVRLRLDWSHCFKGNGS
jgi:hypothetical protein